jgi:hypothetical protein
MQSTNKRLLVRDRILSLLEVGGSMSMKSLALQTYGESKPSHIARVRQQISILRAAGHDIGYERKTKSFLLSRGEAA